MWRWGDGGGRAKGKELREAWGSGRDWLGSLNAAALLTRCCWAQWSPIESRGPCCSAAPLNFGHTLCALLGCLPTAPWRCSSPCSPYTRLSASAPLLPLGDFRTLCAAGHTQECWPRFPRCLTTPQGPALLGPLCGCLQPPTPTTFRWESEHEYRFSFPGFPSIYPQLPLCGCRLE